MSHQVIAFAATLAFIATTQLSAQENPKSVRTPIVTLAGSKSKIVKQKVVRIHSNDEWKALWREHKTGSAKSTLDWDDSETLELNFREVIVIAIFDGTGGDHPHLVPTILENETQVRIRIEPNASQTGTSGDPEIDNRPRKTGQPWGIFVIPRTNKEVILEQDSRRLIADPPKWTEWKKFPKLDLPK